MSQDVIATITELSYSESTLLQQGAIFAVTSNDGYKMVCILIVYQFSLLNSINLDKRHSNGNERQFLYLNVVHSSKSVVHSICVDIFDIGGINSFFLSITYL